MDSNTESTQPTRKRTAGNRRHFEGPIRRIRLDKNWAIESMARIANHMNRIPKGGKNSTGDKGWEEEAVEASKTLGLWPNIPARNTLSGKCGSVEAMNQAIEDQRKVLLLREAERDAKIAQRKGLTLPSDEELVGNPDQKLQSEITEALDNLPPTASNGEGKSNPYLDKVLGWLPQLAESAQLRIVEYILKQPQS